MITYLHYLRAIAAIAVLCSHAGGNLAKTGRAPDGLEAWLAPAAPFGVYLFFALSGFVIAAAHAGDINQPSKLGSYAFKRFTRIYPIYWVVALATLVLGLLSSSLRHPSWGDLAWLMGIVTLLPFHGVDGPQGVPAWTLFHEIVFYGLFAILILSERFGGVVLSLWLASCVAVAATGSKFLYPFLAKENLIFAMGALAFLAYRRRWAAGFAPWAAAIALLALAGAWGLEVVVISDPNLSDATKYLAFGVPAALLLWGLATLERRSGDRVRSGLLSLLGDASYAIYLVHFLVISAIGKARAVLDWQLGPYWAAEFAAVVLIATAFGVAVHVAIERPLLERLRRLSGTSKRCAAGAAPSIRAGGVAV